jgi:hypothetical protein
MVKVGVSQCPTGGWRNRQGTGTSGTVSIMIELMLTKISNTGGYHDYAVGRSGMYHGRTVVNSGTVCLKAQCLGAQGSTMLKELETQVSYHVKKVAGYAGLSNGKIADHTRRHGILLLHFYFDYKFEKS